MRNTKLKGAADDQAATAGTNKRQRQPLGEQ